ncbi:MAG: hydroxylamine reductase [Actinobacteria bacterium HGW-Actinobacteria-1]|jgi:hydroxylamine reductase|nr:MAG: hydroxylamine reductase [Actinobacteria bacterium HGW-Actinobacteria-1]
MFCNQCEQTNKGVGCTTVGVCGKTADVAALQDLVVHQVKGIAAIAVAGAKVGVVDHDADVYTTQALFTTVTNVDFDAEHLAGVIREGAAVKAALLAKVEAAGGVVDASDPAVAFGPSSDLAELVAQGEAVGLFSDRRRDENVQALQQTAVYGLKGIAAYADHARVLGHENPDVYAFMHELLAALSDTSLDLNDWVALTLKTGEVNLWVMELLDAANTGAYGHPVPTSVPLGHRPNKAIVVSGHDLKDIKELLEQTEGLGIDIYTHGEMLPAHGYPELKKYPHFYGHYGTAWQNQRKEFDAFPGAILMTTNCIQNPRDTYADNIFATGRVAHPNAIHVDNGDFKAVIDRALELPGFTDEFDGGSVMVGFGRNAVLSVAPTVIEAVKSGAIKHFFLVGGCDGAKPGRSYYTDFVEEAPADTIVLTLACGKFRFFDKQLGDIGGIPRLLDVGQCNDAYSAIKIAVALAEAFEVGVNELPLSMILSWYEQKAVAILLTLLHLGITDIRLGPTLPAFITPAVLQVLVDNFDIKPIGATAAEDLATILGAA